MAKKAQILLVDFDFKMFGLKIKIFYVCSWEINVGRCSLTAKLTKLVMETF